MRSRFDQFAKQVTGLGFSRAGPVHTDEEVSPDARHIDIWFTPGPAAAATLAPLGLLGRIGSAACTLEPFHCTPGADEVMDCLFKQHVFRGILARRSPETALPTQWIVSSGRPNTALAGLRFKKSGAWGRGIYEAPPLMHTRLVVVSELPVKRDTLLMRLMGAGATFERAVADLRRLPEDAPERVLALPILLRLRLETPADPAQRTRDDEEFLMSTQDIVETFIQQQRSEGRNEGRDEGFAEAVIELYTERFGSPPDDVAALVSQTHDRAALRGWLKLLASGSREEVLAAIRGRSTG